LKAKKSFFTRDLQVLYDQCRDKILYYFHQKIAYYYFIDSQFCVDEDLFYNLYKELKKVFQNPFSNVVLDKTLIYKIGDIYKFYKKLSEEDVLDFEQKIIAKYSEVFNVDLTLLVAKTDYIFEQKNSSDLFNDNVSNYLYTMLTKCKKLSFLDWTEDEIMKIFFIDSKPASLYTKYEWNPIPSKSLKEIFIIRKSEVLKNISCARGSKFGYVYVATNNTYDAQGRLFIKIGQTHKLQERLDVLTRASASPQEFVYLFVIGASNYKKIERLAHQYFEKYRVNKKREFFAVEYRQVIDFLVQKINN
jgi:hypothetical protein